MGRIWKCLPNTLPQHLYGQCNTRCMFSTNSPSSLKPTSCTQIMMQYYYCSRARRGLEYHMSTRYLFIDHTVNLSYSYSSAALSSISGIKLKRPLPQAVDPKTAGIKLGVTTKLPKWLHQLWKKCWEVIKVNPPWKYLQMQKSPRRESILSAGGQTGFLFEKVTVVFYSSPRLSCEAKDPKTSASWLPSKPNSNPLI